MQSVVRRQIDIPKSSHLVKGDHLHHSDMHIVVNLVAISRLNSFARGF